ncbi:MAG: hypothetical protein L6V91_03670 [Bacilli bacterium]|nr:MAG: hypothetical protein L6V91_03670 [Bacilli bacterium]
MLKCAIIYNHLKEGIFYVFKKIFLSGENVVANINENMDKILSYIPEISFLIGFDQKDPDHNLDLWNHTLLALYYSDDEFDVRLALLLHDIGKPYVYKKIIIIRVKKI